MASTDVRDILDVKQDEPPKPAKKQKLVARKPGALPSLERAAPSSADVG
jgi:hypothetical protein